MFETVTAGAVALQVGAIVAGGLGGWGLYPWTDGIARSLVVEDTVSVGRWSAGAWRFTVAGGCAMAAWCVAWRGGGQEQALWAVGLVPALVVLAVVDWRWRVLPDVLVLPLVGLGLLLGGWGVFVSLSESLVGAGLGFGVAWGVDRLYRGRAGHQGIGLGDAKLLAALGAWFGDRALLPVTAGAAILGLVLLTWRWGGRGKRDNGTIPFGTVLAISAWIWLMVGFS